MTRKPEIEFRRDAETLFDDRSHVLVAVSGGGDSVALLHLLARYSRGGRLELSVAHLDHGLRRGSRSDRRFVEELAADLELACHADRRDVPTLRQRGESPEEAARRVRRAFLTETAREIGAQSIATGHTLDDQAETILMRLVRGAGATALTGMASVGPGPFVRPLLRQEREKLRDWLRAKKLVFREDPTNRDLRFDRNRVRRLVLPVLRETLNPRAARHLVKAAQRFREDALLVDQMAEAAFDSCTKAERSGGLAVDASALAAAPPALANRLASLALRRVGADPRRIASRHISALIDLAGGGSGRRLDLPGRIVALRARRWIHLARRDGDAAPRGLVE